MVLVFEDFISLFTAIIKVSWELVNSHGNQLLLILNLGSFILSSVDLKGALSLALK